MYFPAPPRAAGRDGAAVPARGRARFRRSADLAGPGGVHRDRDRQVRHRDGDGLGAAAPAARAPRGWKDHEGELPVVEGTLIRLRWITCPASATRPVWLWSSRAATRRDVNRTWQAFLRRFDIEHTFRFLNQLLGWTRPKLRTRPPPTAGPGSSSPATPSSGSPANSPPISGCPGSSPASPAASPPPASAGATGPPPGSPRSASAPKPSRPGPGRPAGSKEPPPRHPPRRRQNLQANRNEDQDPQADSLNNKLRACQMKGAGG